MGAELSRLLVVAALGTATLSLAYLAFAVYRVWRTLPGLLGPAPALVGELPGVSMLKPLCGHDPQLLENLRSFCEQDYPRFQMVLGARRSDDPAVRVARRIIEEYPGREIELVVDDRLWGTNYKVSNLINMEAHVRYPVLLVADSDMRVPRDYLRRVAAGLADTRVGATTCLYRGRAVGGIYSRLAALFINDWFLPSVLVHRAFGPLRYCFGATMAVRREALEAIGGFGALRDYLADDHMLGQLISRQGYRITLAPCIVENIINEPDLAGLIRHELRWARTMRTLQPWGYGMSWITDTLPATLLALLATVALHGPVLVALSLLVMAVVLRGGLHVVANRAMGTSWARSLTLLAYRDILSLGVRLLAYAGRTVHWREYEFSVNEIGELSSAQPLQVGLNKLAVSKD